MVAFHSKNLQSLYKERLQPVAQLYLDHINDVDEFNEDLRTLEQELRKYKISVRCSSDGIHFDEDEFGYEVGGLYMDSGSICLSVRAISNEHIGKEYMYRGPLREAAFEYRKGIQTSHALCSFIENLIEKLNEKINFFDTSGRLLNDENVKPLSLDAWRKEKADPIDD
jgi:hypothetical protein